MKLSIILGALNSEADYRVRIGVSVELRVEDNSVVISPDNSPRQDWAAAFRAAGPALDDELMLPDTPPNAFDHEDWCW